MRIISTYHDYYDAVQHEGQDLSLIYNREKKTEEAKIHLPDLESREEGLPYYYRRWYNTEKFDYGFRDWVIGFCGKVYPVIGIKRNGEFTYCYSAQETEDAILAGANKRTAEWYTGDRKWRGYGSLLNRKILDQHFDRYEQEFRDKYVEHFRETRIPVFVSYWERRVFPAREHKQVIIYNEALAPFKFVRIFDTFRAFQEIQMFLGSLAQPEKQIPAVSDADMVVAKGFNKWSFRKEPKR